MQIHCPHCNAGLNVAEKAFGRVLPCPACQKEFQVPAPASRRPRRRRGTTVGSGRDRCPPYAVARQVVAAGHAAAAAS